MPKSYSIAEARNSLPRLVHRAERGRPVQLTRHGKPVAYIVSRRQLEQLSSAKVDFWTALQDFRESHDLEELAWTDAEVDRLRDRSPGRRSPFAR